jgi:hypothetical protein
MDVLMKKADCRKSRGSVPLTISLQRYSTQSQDLLTVDYSRLEFVSNLISIRQKIFKKYYRIYATSLILLRGTVSPDFRQTIPLGTLIHGLKWFRIYIRNRENRQYSILFFFCHGVGKIAFWQFLARLLLERLLKRQKYWRFDSVLCDIARSKKGLFPWYNF